MNRSKSWILGVILAACGSGHEPETTRARAPEGPSATEPVVAEESSDPAEAVVDPNAFPTTIDGLVERFNGGFGLWRNGLSPTIEAPATASAQAVLEDVFTRISFDAGPVTEFTIIDERVVQIDDADYTALRLTTNQGPKIALMRYESSQWWTRIYTGES